MPETLQTGPSQTSEAGFFCSAYVGLRCFLLVMVLEGHYWFDATGDTRLHVLTFSVPCFFVLSGYLISHTLFRYEGLPWRVWLKKFYIRRALRILPPFYFVLLVAHLVKPVPYLAWHSTYLFNFKIFYISAFQPAYFAEYMSYGDFKAVHFWSVNVEEQFYILYPVFLLLTFKARRTLGFVLAIMVTILIRAYLYENMRYSFYGGLSLVSGEYILWGGLFAWMDFHKRWLKLRSSWALYGSILAFALLSLFDDSYGPYAQWKPSYLQTFYAILLSVFVLSLRYCKQSLVARLLSWKGLRFVGSISYTAYLVHLFLNPLVDELTTRYPILAPFPACPRAVLGLLLTLAVASLIWVGLEQPINRARRKLTEVKK